MSRLVSLSARLLWALAVALVGAVLRAGCRQRLDTHTPSTNAHGHKDLLNVPAPTRTCTTRLAPACPEEGCTPVTSLEARSCGPGRGRGSTLSGDVPTMSLTCGRSEKSAHLAGVSTP
jgi:hypothetical protein